MSKPLKNPELPPGAIVETYEDGGALRNDGVTLTPASQNPWYVLATVAGEQEGKYYHQIDHDLHAKNRRFWNGWMCRAMEDGERAALAEKLGLPEEELAPLTSEEIATVRARFEAAFPDRAFKEVLPGPHEVADLHRVHFHNSFVCEKFRLFCLVNFEKAHFSNSAFFQEAHFEGGAEFQNAHFSGPAFFREMHLPSLADFQEVCFNEGGYFQRVRFGRSTFFQGAQFIEVANFRDAQFFGDFLFYNVRVMGGAQFQGTRFTASSYFENSQFNFKVCFSQACFGEFTDFGKVNFNSGVEFLEAHFSGEADFREARFTGDADFQETHFTGVAFFEEAHFAGDADFREARFQKGTNFSDGSFKAKTVFDGAEFKGEVPEFFHREMHQDTGFTDDPKLWPEVTVENAKAGKRAYTRLRQVAAEIYDPDLEHFFLRQEMRCKARIEWDKGAWFHWLFFVLYRGIADSGISVARPFWLLVFAWAFGVACFAGHFDSGVLPEMPEDIQDSRYWAAAGVSFGNLFGFLGINRLYFTEVLRDHSPDGLQLVAGAQTVAGVVLLFFLGLGLRNRFRLK